MQVSEREEAGREKKKKKKGPRAIRVGSQHTHTNTHTHITHVYTQTHTHAHTRKLTFLLYAVQYTPSAKTHTEKNAQTHSHTSKTTESKTTQHASCTHNTLTRAATLPWPAIQKAIQAAKDVFVSSTAGSGSLTVDLQVTQPLCSCNHASGVTHPMLSSLVTHTHLTSTIGPKPSSFLSPRAEATASTRRST